jgi:hypothetical protein
VHKLAKEIGCHATTIIKYVDKNYRVGPLAEYYVKTQKINLIHIPQSDNDNIS